MRQLEDELVDGLIEDRRLELADDPPQDRSKPLPLARRAGQFKPCRGGPRSVIEQQAATGEFDPAIWKVVKGIDAAKRQTGRPLRPSELAEIFAAAGWRPPHD